ncbi:hypothetical protein RHMOL_Rhmol01G0103900 [Rhododendron molle]|uniref:Uncharacterized protein n=1 Tax=Rhododendron molle TaxID=49168 RepID=A0ACC0Q1T7_RHOML|nr:hypothetical protein RHMOL_Rhmol01G0103900 [Rhododendron molle]
MTILPINFVSSNQDISNSEKIETEALGCEASRNWCAMFKSSNFRNPIIIQKYVGWVYVAVDDLLFYVRMEVVETLCNVDVNLWPLLPKK